ncbi:MAG TPA: energy transducer TonB [Candidatus Angelobacter sp.]
MFRENLLESAPSGRKRKRWPIALAFSAEMVVGALLVALPLLSTGVISVSAHAPLVATLGRPDLPRESHPPASGGVSVPHPLIVPITTACLGGCLLNPHPAGTSDAPNPGPPDVGQPNGIPDLPFGGPAAPPELQQSKSKPPVLISHLAEAQLLTKVDPVYPHMAIVTGTQGEVRLHAIIAKDGSIESLNVISGHPMLVRAAADAVRQWRYRPYYLNGQAVEVETFITVNFKKTNE